MNPPAVMVGGANDKVRAALESLVHDTPEIGVQVAAYLNGKLVIDAWAGMADPANNKPVDEDTLFMLSSTTKGLTSTLMHILVEKHKLSYDMPIVKVWPEFGAHGKQDATLRNALSHQTGVPQTPVGFTPEWIPDWDRMCKGIADLTPMFPIGERTAYHSLTFGYINGEILRRVDGRTIAQFLQDELCKPLGINGAYLGVPDGELHRVAVLTDAPPAPPEYDRMSPIISTGVNSSRRPSRHPAACSAPAALPVTTPCWPNGARLMVCVSSRKIVSAQGWNYRATRWMRFTRSARCVGSAGAAAGVPVRWPRRQHWVTSVAAAHSVTPIRPGDWASPSRKTILLTAPAAP